MEFRLALVALLLLGTLCRLNANDHAPDQFDHHPDVEIKLFASEPQVVDPVCIAFAANGDCFVVEMRDYPYGFGENRKPGGTIRLLRDTDRNGSVDVSRPFAKGLSYPTSVMPWRDGILVLAPPQILFLRDTNGDDVADESRVLLDGLKLGVTDSNANSLRWGVDGLIHVANGGNGGTAWLTERPDERVNLGDWDFAIDVKRKKILRTGQTGGGFGLVFDESGNSFTTYNIDYLQQRIIPYSAVENSPEMFPFDATENISKHGESAQIFPIVQAETRVNHPEQAGHFSSAGGMGLLESGPLHDALGKSVFVCDVVCNLVHRDLLQPLGAAFQAERAPEELDREFIASRDPACRPIGLEHGPDGAMYLVDMQRDVIEHPDYIPEQVLKSMDVRAGDDRGRIYRVIPKAGLSPNFERIDTATTSRLVQLLSSPHRWQSETAHRLLVDRGDSDTGQNSGEIIAEVSKQLWGTANTDATPSGQVRSLWLLRHFEELSDSIIENALRHSSPIVRATAIQLTPNRDHSQGLRDPIPSVRFQAALALDRASTPEKLPEIANAIFQCNDKWMRRALLLAVNDQGDQLLYRTVEQAKQELELHRKKVKNDQGNDDLNKLIIREVADVAAAGLNENNHGEFQSWLESQLNRENQFQTSIVEGLNAGWTRRRGKMLPVGILQPIVHQWFENIKTIRIQSNTAGEPALVAMLDLMATCKIAPAAHMQQLIAEALDLANDDEADTHDRILAIRIASKAANLGANRQEVFDLLGSIVESPTTPELHKAAISGMRQLRDPSTARLLCERWSSISPSVRVELINMLLSRQEYHSDLLTAIENETVKVSELNLDLEQRRTLLRWSSEDIGRRAAKYFGDEEYSNRKEIVREWLAKLPDTGDPVLGMKVYKQKCSTCHVSRGEGHRVGPDLQAMSHRSVEDLLTHILDPNMSINPNYVSCVVQTVDGEIMDGLLKQESSESVTLMQPDAKQTTIARSDIESFRTLPTSLMPEGLEKDLSPENLRDLIAYLQEKP